MNNLIRTQKRYHPQLLVLAVCLMLSSIGCSSKKVVNIPVLEVSPAVVSSPAAESEEQQLEMPEAETAAVREEIVLPPSSVPPASTSPAPVVVAAEAAELKPETTVEDKFSPNASLVTLWPEESYALKRFVIYQREQGRWAELGTRLQALDLEELQPDRWMECSRLITENAAGYLKLQQQLALGGASAGAAVEGYNPWLIVQQDIDYLESGCAEVLEQTETELFRRLDEYGLEAARQAEQTIDHFAAGSGYEQAIAAFRSLQEMTPERQLSPAVKKLYGNALLRTGQLEEAAAVFAGILAIPGAAGADEWKLRRQMADIFLAMGRVDEAQREYEALAGFGKRMEKEQQWAATQLELVRLFPASPEESALYLATLRAFIASDGRSLPSTVITGLTQMEEKYPESAFTRQVRNINIQLGEQVGEWVGAQLVEADRLFEAKEYREAVAVLDRLLAVEMPTRLEEAVLKTMDEVLLAEKQVEEEEQQLLLQALNRQWEEGMSLVDQQLYPQAIEVLSALLGTDFEEKARLKIGEVSNLAAAEMRRQAADLFVRAGKTGDPALKGEFMLQSRQLLQDALSRYPGVSIVDKLTRNLEVVEAQIRLLNPSLLTEVVSGNDSNDSFQLQSPPVAGDEALKSLE